jgi:hypothetical protein
VNVAGNTESHLTALTANLCPRMVNRGFNPALRAGCAQSDFFSDMYGETKRTLAQLQHFKRLKDLFLHRWPRSTRPAISLANDSYWKSHPLFRCFETLLKTVKQNIII